MNERCSFWGEKGNADKRGVISLIQCPRLVMHNEGAQLWKSTGFLLFVATASHVNDQFGRNNVINIRRSRGVGDYRDGWGVSGSLPLLADKAVGLQCDACRSHETGGDAKTHHIKHRVQRYLKKKKKASVLCGSHHKWSKCAFHVHIYRVFRFLSSACSAVVQISLRYLSEWPEDWLPFHLCKSNFGKLLHLYANTLQTMPGSVEPHKCHLF